MVALRQSDYVVLSEIECSDIIEFCKKEDFLEVRELRESLESHKKTSDIETMGRSIISLEPPKYSGHFKSGEYFTKEIKFKRSVILHSEYEQEVINKAL